MVTKNPYLFENYALYSNKNRKAIFIEGLLQPIYHVVKKVSASKNLITHKAVPISEILAIKQGLPAIIMLATTDVDLVKQLTHYNEQINYEGTIIYSRKLDIEDLHISSVEI